MYGSSRLSPLQKPPWRQVQSSVLFQGPKGGLRVHLVLDCGHTLDRVARKTEDTGDINQEVARCYPCWWTAGNSFKAHCGQTHFSH